MRLACTGMLTAATTEPSRARTGAATERSPSSTWARVRHLLWPTALPYVMTGIRLAAAVALVLAITAELVIGTPGLGARIAVAQASHAVPDMYALVAVTGLLGVLINLGARAVERRSLAWHQSVRGEAAV